MFYREIASEERNTVILDHLRGAAIYIKYKSKEQESFPQFNMQKFMLQIKLLSSNRISSLFDHQYLQKELIDLSVFLHRNIHQKN